jgi:hypothetical protein
VKKQVSLGVEKGVNLDTQSGFGSLVGLGAPNLRKIQF